MKLHGKTVIITGAARIGQTVAHELAKQGTNLVISYRNSKVTADQVKKDAENLGAKVLLVQADVSKENDVKTLIDQAVQTFGSIDVLVHMAASYTKTPFASLTEHDFDNAMATIAKSAYMTSTAAAVKMQGNKNEIKGKIITISDWSIFRNPYKEYLPYNTAKAAVVGLTLSLARELAPYITVNCIAPGPILRPPTLTEEENAEVMGKTPMQRWGGADEIAKAVCYLLDSDFVTGQILTVDGGRSIA